MTDIFGQVTEVMSDLFGVDPATLTIQSSKATVEGWDSLQQVNLLLDIEQRFDLQLQSEEIAKLKTVGDIVAMIERKRASS